MRKKAYRAWFEIVFAEPRGRERLRGEALRQFALAFDAQLEAAGAFDLRAEGTPETLLLKTSRSYSSRGTVLWPVGLATKMPDIADGYSEEALMLVRTGMSFHPAKVVLHEAPFWLCLTRHCLERLIERDGVGDDLPVDLPPAWSVLRNRAGLALANGIAIEVDDGEWSRTAFVPHQGGLFVLTNRLVAGPTFYDDLGFKFNLTKRHSSNTYIKRGLVAPAYLNPKGGVCVSTWVATTYLAQDQLSAGQRKYVNQFEEWVALQTEADTRLAVQMQFDPDFTFIPSRHLAHSSVGVEQLLEKLRRSVESPAFKPHARVPVGYLIEPDMDSRAYRAALRDRMSA